MWGQGQTPYNSNLIVVKRDLLKIDDTADDDTLRQMQLSAFAEINNILKFFGFNVPLSSPDQNVKDAENYFLAAYFREREDSAEAEKLYARGKAFLQKYMDAEKAAEETAFKVVQA